MGAPVHVGDLLADKYEVTRILGQGGMGVVVAARHRELDKLVALKFMHEEVAMDPVAIDRFLREAKAAARLQNEHVGRVLDVGRLQTGVPYIVLEYLEGRDLSEVTADAGGALPVSEVCEYLLQTCEAMAEAHAQGIIHRDLKPQNLFLTMRPDGRPLLKVLDFGISKVQSSTGPTSTQQVMGTPAYMSPEQMRSAKSCDGRADIWSLGVILYQLLSGTLPFAGDSVAETMLKVMTDEPAPLTSLRPGLPPALVAAVAKCLRKQRDERFDNVAELAHELTPFAPERARAAMSLIERVMSAGVPRPAQDVAHDSFAAVVPAVAKPGNVATTEPPNAPRQSVQQTTLGGAASALSLDERRPASSSAIKWIALSVVAIAATVVITVVATRGGGDAGTTAASSPSDASSAVTELPKPPVDPKPPADPKPADHEPAVAPRPVDASDPKPHDPKPSGVKPTGTKPNKPRAGSGSAITQAGSAAPQTGSSTPVTQPPTTTGSGSGSPKVYKPVGEDRKPLTPVGEGS